MREERHLFLETLVEKAEAGEAIDVKGEVTRLLNNLVTRMIVSHRFSGSDDDATQMKELLREIMELLNSFNVLDFIPFSKKLDLQGLKKKARKVRGGFDEIVERIMKAREEERSKRRDLNAGGNAVKDFLNILLDTMEDEKQEMRLTRENVIQVIN